jgi:hypothetical protein
MEEKPGSYHQLIGTSLEWYWHIIGPTNEYRTMDWNIMEKGNLQLIEAEYGGLPPSRWQNYHLTWIILNSYGNIHWEYPLGISIGNIIIKKWSHPLRWRLWRLWTWGYQMVIHTTSRSNFGAILWRPRGEKLESSFLGKFWWRLPVYQFYKNLWTHSPNSS